VRPVHRKPSNRAAYVPSDLLHPWQRRWKLDCYRRWGAVFRGAKPPACMHQISESGSIPGASPSGDPCSSRRLRYVRCMAEPQGLAAVIEESHRAVDAFMRGDPAPLQALFSQRGDVCLANPFGPAQRGWPQVRDTMARAAANYRDGRALGIERIAEYLSPELSCIHELERFEAKVGGSEETTQFALRCTSVFRLEDGRWRIVLRHADPITAARSAESVIQT
jgi:ketosteroid isomerase-like protein